MKLQLRLSLLVSILITLVSTAIGTFAISTTHNQQLATNDANVEEIVFQIASSTEDPLSLATFLLDQSDFKFSLALVTGARELVEVDDVAGNFPDLPTDIQLSRGTKKAVVLSDMRVRTVALEDDEYLLIGYSTRAVNEDRKTNVLYLGLFTLIVLAIAITLSIWLFRADAQLSQAATALQDSQNRMREFLGDAAHELRTPLTIIRGYFELLQRGEGDRQKQSSYADRIGSEIARMQSLIDDLLLVAELDSKPSKAALETDLDELLRAEIETLATLEPRRPIASQIDAGINVVMEREYAKRLLANIFSNLRRYTPDDSPITVSASRLDDWVELIIEDSGPGLPKKFYEQGIRAFQRFDQSRSRESGGSGLGMSIIEKVVVESGGSVRLAPSKAGGLLISIKLPRAT